MEYFKVDTIKIAQILRENPDKTWKEIDIILQKLEEVEDETLFARLGNSRRKIFLPN